MWQDPVIRQLGSQVGFFWICKTPTFSSDDPKSSYRSVDVFFSQKKLRHFFVRFGGGGVDFFWDIAENEKV